MSTARRSPGERGCRPQTIDHLVRDQGTREGGHHDQADRQQRDLAAGRRGDLEAT
jgi:hypothetical protein